MTRSRAVKSSACVLRVARLMRTVMERGRVTVQIEKVENRSRAKTEKKEKI